MQEYRSPRALDRYIATHGAGASPALDALCAQKDAHTALLYWFTDLRAAIAEAQRTKRPILSLRLLGRLDEELSCANSRFFRKRLYCDPLINQVLRHDFVLHWQSVRPVPRVVIDFGDGRRIEKTLTGNSVHLVLDVCGNPVDAIPGLFSREAFLEQLVQARRFAEVEIARLAQLHERALRRAFPEPVTSRVVAASRIAMTKHVVEGPMLRAVAPAEEASDTAQNRLLHRRVHEAFAAGARWQSIESFVDWIYADLFVMPLSDPTLGLDMPDPV